MIILILSSRPRGVGAGESVVFLHTGGTPALFPYREEIVSLIEGPAYARLARWFTPSRSLSTWRYDRKMWVDTLTPRVPAA